MLILKPTTRKPDFRNLERVLMRDTPDRPTLFEFFLNDRLYRKAPGIHFDESTPYSRKLSVARAFEAYGYDYVTVIAGDYCFTSAEKQLLKTQSLNDLALIRDRESFGAYMWPDIADFPMDDLSRLAEDLPAGMKVIAYGPGGVLENVVQLVGYDHLCMMLYDDPELAGDIFEGVGTCLLNYYKTVLEYEVVGAVISNDDWGFNTQTMLSPADLRKYVFPWHKKIVEAAHQKGRPAILHSCGKYDAIIDDVIDDMGFDARHSYEDNIEPIETAYDKLHHRIALLGGIDLNYVCSSTPEEVYLRAKNMLIKGQSGGYALGTGNSVPDYVPDENYFAMIRAALE